MAGERSPQRDNNAEKVARRSHRRSEKVPSRITTRSNTHAVASSTGILPTTTSIKKSSLSEGNVATSKRAHRRSRRDSANRDRRHSTRADAADSSRRHSRQQQQVADNDKKSALTVKTRSAPTTPHSKKSSSERKPRSKSRVKQQSDAEVPITITSLPMPGANVSRRPSITSRRASPTNILGSSAPLRAASISKLGDVQQVRLNYPNNDSDDAAPSSTRRRASRSSQKRVRAEEPQTTSRRRTRRSRAPSNSRRRPKSRSNSQINVSPSFRRRRRTTRRGRNDDDAGGARKQQYPIPVLQPALTLSSSVVQTEYEKCLPEALQDIYQILTDLGYSLSLDDNIASTTSAETFVNALSQQVDSLKSNVAETDAKCALLTNDRSRIYDRSDQLQSSMHYLEEALTKHASLLTHKASRADGIRHEQQQAEHVARERHVQADIEFDKRKKILRQKAREREKQSNTLNNDAETLASSVEQLRSGAGEQGAKCDFIAKRIGQWRVEKQNIESIVGTLRHRAQRERVELDEFQRKMLEDYTALDAEHAQLKQNDQDHSDKSSKARQVYEAQLDHLQTQQQYGAREMNSSLQQLQCVSLRCEQALSKAKRNLIMEFENLYSREITPKRDGDHFDRRLDEKSNGRNKTLDGVPLLDEQRYDPEKPALSTGTSPSKFARETTPANPAEPLPSARVLLTSENSRPQTMSSALSTVNEQDEAKSRADPENPDEKFQHIRMLAEKTEALIQQLNRRLFTNNNNKISRNAASSSTDNNKSNENLTPPFASGPPNTTKIDQFVREQMSQQQQQQQQHESQDKQQTNNDDEISSIGTYTLINQLRNNTNAPGSFPSPPRLQTPLPYNSTNNQISSGGGDVVSDNNPSLIANSHNLEPNSNRNYYSYFLPISNDNNASQLAASTRNAVTGDSYFYRRYGSSDRSPRRPDRTNYFDNNNRSSPSRPFRASPFSAAAANKSRNISRRRDKTPRGHNDNVVQSTLPGGGGYWQPQQKTNDARKSRSRNVRAHDQSNFNFNNTSNNNDSNSPTHVARHIEKLLRKSR